METIKDLNFLNTLLPLAVIIFIIGTGVVFLNLHFQKNLSSQKLKQEALKRLHASDLLKSNIQAQEEERKRIAQDLHDELGAVIAILSMHLMMLEQQSNREASTLLPSLQNARQLSETALSSLRSISHQLMPPQLASFGLIKTLESVITQTSQTGALQIQLAAPSSDILLSWIVSLTLYRVIMELISNTIKHAGASQASIELFCTNKEVTCQYSDNGKGLSGNNNGKGLGFKSIEGRVSALEGTCTWGNNATGGFYAFIKIPINHNE